MSQATQAALSLEILDGDVARLTFDLPGSRANTLGQAVLAEFDRHVKDLATRADLRGLLLRSTKPGMFIAGADLKELGSAKADPDTTRAMVQRGLGILAALEELPYPTVAVIDGSCMGGGLETAMSFDYRIAGTNPKTEFGQPEVKVGLIPGWGGTQRLSRLVGPALAIEMCCGGDPLKAARARQMGLIFDIVPSDALEQEALRLLKWSRETGDWKQQRTRKRQPVGLSEEQAAFTFAVSRGQILAKTGGKYPAPLAALDAIAKGCNLPLADGLKAETDAFVPLVGSPVSRNLIAIFFMTQRLQKDTGVNDSSVVPQEVKQVGVIGSGIMGGGIAGAHIRRGVPIMMTDTSPEALKRGVNNIIKNMQARITIGRMTVEDTVAAMSLLSSGSNNRGLSDRDVVIEAIIEAEAAKVRLYERLKDVLPANCILASNTSTISITRLAEAWPRPELFAGMHFFNPVDRMQLVEVIRGEKTADQTIVTLVSLAKRIGKTPIVVRDCPGFLVNRVLFPYMNEALAMLEEGASPRGLDKAATAFGMPMGPITLQDVVGLDTSLYAGNVVAEAYPDRSVKTSILGLLVDRGRLGQKSGAGFYSYAKGTRGADDPLLADFLGRVRKGTREIGQEEMTERLFFPMLCEASRALAEGIVREPGDVDMGLILGIGFPAFRGGILRWADQMGLATVLEKLKKYDHLGGRFQPTDQMRHLAASGKGFYQE